MNIRPFSFSILGSTILFITGCQWDPSLRYETSPAPEIPWSPPCPIPVLTTPPTEHVQTERKMHPFELIDIGLQNNPLTHRAWHIARSAAYDVDAARSALYPFINLQQTYEYTSVKGSAAGAGASQFDNGGIGGLTGAAGGATGPVGALFPNQTQTLITELSFSYLLLDFGGRQAQINAAKQALITANWLHNRTIQSVILSILTAYYSHNGWIDNLAAREKDLKDSEQNLKAAEGRFESGVGTKLDVLLAKSNFANAKLDVETAKSQVSISHGQLAKAIGWPANADFTIEKLPEVKDEDTIGTGLDGLMEIAKVERPDLAAAFSNFQEIKQDIIVAFSAGEPTISLGGSYQNTSVFKDARFNNRIYQAGVSLNFPLFAGFLYESQVRSFRERAAAAFSEWQDTETTVLLQVLTAYYDYKTAIETLKYSKEYLSFSQEAYSFAFISFKDGVGSFLDLLAAQTALSQARTRLILSETQLVTSIANLSYAMGTL